MTRSQDEARILLLPWIVREEDLRVVSLVAATVDAALAVGLHVRVQSVADILSGRMNSRLVKSVKSGNASWNDGREILSIVAG